ncbi:LysE family translocator [Desulfovibrio mangrovi]|uniref:LysE family translocator n=1 Tax=Desulfovibrio mangrovi TaxID=2976983 RepID=UPI00224641BD|nr:LysE family translocator [Desulfovibrio mangrovi]UZP67133.1 LysE family translocator [Desulfovibrio mangrovi]
MALSTWIAYALIMTVIAYTPGPMTLFSMSSGVRHGFWRTLPGIMGGSSAYIIQMCIVYVGLGAAVQSSQIFFQSIKWAGVAYLFVLGIRNWRAASSLLDISERVCPVSARKQYALGFATGMSNPKSILVFTALFPQFIRPEGNYTLQYLILGVSFFVLQLSSASTYAACGSRIVNWLVRRRMAHMQGRVTGGILFLAGGALALSRR